MENEGMLSLRQLVEAVTAEAMWRQEERLRALEARVDSLEDSIKRALEKVFPRVDALVSQLEKQDSCPTTGCPTSIDSGLSDQLAKVSISAVRSEVHTGSVPVQSASCSSSSCPQNTHFDARSSTSQTCASTCPPVSSSTSVFGHDGLPSRRSSPPVEVSCDALPTLSGAVFTLAPCTSASVAFPTASASNSGFPSMSRNRASTVSATAVANFTRFSISSAASPSVSRPSEIDPFNPFECSARTPLYARGVRSDQPVHAASSVTTTTASLPRNTSTSGVNFNSSPSRYHYSGGFTFSSNISSTLTTVSLPAVTSSCVVSNQFSSFGSGGSYQLTSPLDVPGNGSFQTAVEIISPSDVLHIPSSSSFTTSSTQQTITTSHFNSTRVSARTPIASSRNALTTFGSTPSSSLPSVVPTYANSSPSATNAHSYSTAIVGNFPSNPASSGPSVFSVPNVFGLSCVPSAWH